MGRNKLTRILALCLALVCLVGTVAAASLSWDLSGDGKTNVWDLQLAVKEGKTADELAAALTEALGGTNELTPNADGVYEIYSLVGLYNMREHATEGKTFKLMRDLDLMGADWAPVAGFMGTFDGNNKTISNMKITKSTVASDGNNMGMFGDTANADNDTNRTVVKNLNLADVQILITDENVRYVGGFVGTNRGDLNDCTFTGVITDTRTKLAKTNYIGTLAGRNANRTVNKVSVANGKITGSNSLDALEYYDYEPVKNATKQSDPYTGALKVNSQVALHLADLEEGSASRNFGIAGHGGSGTGAVPTDLLIQDTTNSSKYDDPILLERRNTVTAMMYEMSTVEWTPSQTLRYIRRTAEGSEPSTAANPTSTYTAGSVIRGIPYNHGSSGIERFLSNMEKNADGRWQTLSSLPTVAGYYTVTAKRDLVNAAYDEYHAEGTTEARKTELMAEYPEIEYMTAHLTGGQFGFNMYIGADCSSQATWAWRTVSASTGTGAAKPTNTGDMYMSEYWMGKTGIVPVNGFILEDTRELDLNNDGTKDGTADKSLKVKEYTRANKDFYMETLSYVTKGDLLMDYTDKGGHTLMAMSDAVTIRTYNGVVDLDKSYIVTAEQGGSGGSRRGTTDDGKTWTSSCCADEVNSFNKLYNVSSTDEYPGIFFPITCAALQEVDTPAATATCTMKSGKISSNFHIVSTTVNGQTVYTQIQQSSHRSACTSLTVATAHPEVKTGDTVEVKLSNGQVYTFTY